MTWPEYFASEHEYRTLILAPTANDARLTAGFLEAAGVAAELTPTVAVLCDKVVEGSGVVIVAEEVLTQASVERLFGVLNGQPTWSDLPLILITTGGTAGADRVRRLAALGSTGNVTILERPFRPATLVTVVENALRARRRQYQARKLLDDLNLARDAAEKANKAKDEFLAALSHELRTPLNPVLLLSTDYAADPALPDSLRRDFDQIARNISLEARLIDDLLDLTRITQGKLKLDFQFLDAHAALREALATTNLDIVEKNLELTVDLRAMQTSVAADGVRLQQVLWNVLKNAAKFTPPGGRIRVQTCNEDSQLVVRISDSGVGMDAGELSRVFEAFAQGNHSRPNSGHRFGGLGLGLAISRKLMEAHGGTITAASEGPDSGSTFTIRFPVADVPDSVSARTPAAGSLRLNEVTVPTRVLLVEDHQGTRVSLARLLQRRGFRVEAASSLEQARVLLAGDPFDLLISDIGLPDGSGYELMPELRGHPGMKAIAISGYGMESDVACSCEAGFFQHLTKPVSMQALDAALEACLATPSQPAVR